MCNFEEIKGLKKYQRVALEKAIASNKTFKLLLVDAPGIKDVSHDKYINDLCNRNNETNLEG